MTPRNEMLVQLDAAIRELSGIRAAVADTMYLPYLLDRQVLTLRGDVLRLWDAVKVSSPEWLDTDPQRSTLPDPPGQPGLAGQTPAEIMGAVVGGPA